MGNTSSGTNLNIQKIEKFVRVTGFDKDLLDNTTQTFQSAHEVVHFAYGSDLLCQSLDQSMISSILHFKFFGSSTWAHIVMYCLYDPSSANAIFGGVSIHDPI